MVRASEAHSADGTDIDAVAHFLTEKHMPLLPASCHGARQSFVQSILFPGLLLPDRQSVIFAISPRWGGRVGHRQRSCPRESTAMVLLDKEWAIKGNQFLRSPSLKIYRVGSFGTLSVPRHIMTARIETVLYRMAVPHISVSQRSLTVKPFAMTIARPRREGHP